MSMDEIGIQMGWGNGSLPVAVVIDGKLIPVVAAYVNPISGHIELEIKL